jgi:hypothetical protein
VGAEVPALQSNARAGNTNRRAGPTAELTAARDACRPPLGETAAAESATPSWAAIHLRIAADLVPSARIADRSITLPPEM